MALRRRGASQDRVRGLRSRLRRVTRAIAGLNRAQRRYAVLVAAPDRHLPHRDRAPETYGEFIYRTSGPLLREPSAERRAGGQLIG